jgi:hypothetical protein
MSANLVALLLAALLLAAPSAAAEATAIINPAAVLHG